jgi:mRNA-degrading endonuclease RelE of RelBE toxin-antitoxin system
MRKNVYVIEWAPQAARQFRKIKDSALKQRILAVLEDEIARDPLIGKPLTFVFKGVRSYRLGRLRILYKPYKERLVVVVLRVEDRKRVYRRK